MRALAFALGALVLLVATPAAARRPKRHFEPDDLELEEPGTFEVNLQFGPVRGPDAWRFVAPDVEVDMGITPEVELDVDGAYAREAGASGSFSLDHDAPDNIWVSMKLGLYDDHDAASGRAFAVGLQLGPKLPVERDAHGLGYEAVGLAGWTWPRSQLVLQAGGLVDPGAAIGSGRPVAIEAGVDFELDFDAAKVFALTAELGTVAYVTGDPLELQATAGPQWSPNDALSFSLVGLVGLSPGSDRFGVLFGVAKKFALDQ